MRISELAIAAIFCVLAVSGCATTNKHVEPAAPLPAAELPSVQRAQQPARLMHINAAGLQIIKESEGVHLTAYQDTGQWLIGYGHADGARPGLHISQARAEELLKQDLVLCERAVTSALSGTVTSNQFSALVSLCYNIGGQRFGQSTIVKRLNSGDTQGAADGFLDWTRGSIDGRKVVLPRLEARRQKERSLFLAAS